MGHREDLLAAARRCLEERGYARTTARDLVAESGTNLASIGYHFGSKDALLHEAIAASFDEWARRVHAIVLEMAPEPDPPRRLAASWTAMVRTFEQHRGLAVAFVEALAQAERRPELRDLLAATYERGRATVAAMIVQSLADLPPEQARALASFQIAMCDGLLMQWLLDPAATPTGEDIAAALVAGLDAPGISPAPTPA
ncbi:MAG: TetR/AcrR family transcriptional regulator [Pseudonocardia sp.]